MYAIDSLRQLGIKYLERSELASFTFQNDILKPFVILMRNGRSEPIRKLIVDCIVQVCLHYLCMYPLTLIKEISFDFRDPTDGFNNFLQEKMLHDNRYCNWKQMIRSKIGSIKSGWRSVFMVFTAAANDELESIVENAFENVEQGFGLTHCFISIIDYIPPSHENLEDPNQIFKFFVTIGK